MDLDMNTDPSVDFEGDDDGVYYAELRRQILQLTADDDEDNSVKAAKRGTNGSTGGFPTALPPGSFINGWENENTNSVPTWLVNLWRKGNGIGNGTGVFIPRAVKTRRNRPGRMIKEKRKQYRRVENK